MQPFKAISNIAIDPSCKNLAESAFIKACRGERTNYTPIWLMRQAGRYMQEYRALRNSYTFLELCKRPELAAEVTVMAVEQLGVDAAIIFADILLILEPLAIGLEFTRGEGPHIMRPLSSLADVTRLKHFKAEEELAFVGEAIKRSRRDLNASVPLIGFAGAPFTLASYLIEGGSSRDFRKVKTFMYCEKEGWHELMTLLADLTIDYLNFQIKSGAQAVQLFDSWVGCLSQTDYQEFVFPYMRRTIAGIVGDVPVIHFGTDTAHLLPFMVEAGGDVIGLDWRLKLDAARQLVGDKVAIQGNLDPSVLLAHESEIRLRAEQVLKQAGGKPGHIFNLGHGVLPQTPFKNVKFLVDLVHELGHG